MKIIYILPSFNIRGSEIIFEHINGLSSKGHEVLVTSLDEPKSKNKSISPTKLEVARKEFDSADVIIGYNPVCAFYVNDIETKARKYCLLLNDERKYYAREYISEINGMDKHKLEIEHDKQQKFIEASYDLPIHYLVSNKALEQEFINRKRKVTLIPVGVNQELFYPDEYIPKTDLIRIITDANNLPWQNTGIVSRALSELRQFELWTFGNDKPKVKTDKHWGNLTEEMHRKLFSSSSIFINMSTIDGTAEMSLKAMACGCAVVTRMTDGGESVYLDGKNCIIVEGETDEEISDNLKIKLEELMTDKQLLETVVRGGLATGVPYDIENLEKGLKRK